MKALICIPCIDRDHDIQSNVYQSIHCPIEFSILVALRKRDVKCYEFWKDKAAIITLPDYEIAERHNWEMMCHTFNILKMCFDMSDFDVMTIVESDIILNKDTLSKHYRSVHQYDVVLSYYDVPWAGEPVIVKGDFPFTFVSKTVKEPGERVLGSGTGCTTLKRGNRASFQLGEVHGIEGQDVGFFIDCYKKGHSVFMVNDHLDHLYNRKKNE